MVIIKILAYVTVYIDITFGKPIDITNIKYADTFFTYNEYIFREQVHIGYIYRKIVEKSCTSAVLKNFFSSLAR